MQFIGNDKSTVRFVFTFGYITRHNGSKPDDSVQRSDISSRRIATVLNIVGVVKVFIVNYYMFIVLYR